MFYVFLLIVIVILTCFSIWMDCSLNKITMESFFITQEESIIPVRQEADVGISQVTQETTYGSIPYEGIVPIDDKVDFKTMWSALSNISNDLHGNHIILETKLKDLEQVNKNFNYTFSNLQYEFMKGTSNALLDMDETNGLYYSKIETLSNAMFNDMQTTRNFVSTQMQVKDTQIQQIISELQGLDNRLGSNVQGLNASVSSLNDKYASLSNTIDMAVNQQMTLSNAIADGLFNQYITLSNMIDHVHVQSLDNQNNLIMNWNDKYASLSNTIDTAFNQQRTFSNAIATDLQNQYITLSNMIDAAYVQSLENQNNLSISLNDKYALLSSEIVAGYSNANYTLHGQFAALSNHVHNVLEEAIGDYTFGYSKDTGAFSVNDSNVVMYTSGIFAPSIQLAQSGHNSAPAYEISVSKDNTLEIGPISVNSTGNAHIKGGLRTPYIDIGNHRIIEQDGGIFVVKIPK